MNSELFIYNELVVITFTQLFIINLYIPRNSLNRRSMIFGQVPLRYLFLPYVTNHQGNSAIIIHVIFLSIIMNKHFEGKFIDLFYSFGRKHTGTILISTKVNKTDLVYLKSNVKILLLSVSVKLFYNGIEINIVTKIVPIIYFPNHHTNICFGFF